MTNWTDPVNIVPNSVSDSARFNTEVLDNLRHLHTAKVCRLGRLGGTVLPHNSNYAVQWDWQVFDTIGAWSATPYPERIYPAPGGYFRVSGQFTFPAAPNDSIGFLSLSTVAGSTITTVARGTTRLSGDRSVTCNFSAIVEMDGIGEYLVCYLYQDSGGPLTLNPLQSNSFDLEWIGA